MENSVRKLLRKSDVIIIVLLIGAVFAYYFLLADSGGSALISRGGVVIAELPLNVPGEFVFPQVPDMVFTVADGSISVSESDCGDRTCVRTGKISHRGETIICVPNRIIVEIKTDESGVDAVL
ncbi:MAG: NusG domain II-containing protein [Muribaculaceae bacterium]|nr:NusG domain II-containing protein [Muribaculaceae bacterium]MCM1479233.1 NusG domain II-containing protein [Muribaculaceae bacterium]